ncbi:DUF3782 domain-containing protein [Halochromatium salexigens]|uniref:DUF3782 domain-containing protein n=2 Tax=Halochromatium salexigens TaxID=49447 RepID=A0AAJ0UEM7_HALSE|nr:DUF3782 domain-containing protein [Halochromatium salexigens]
MATTLEDVWALFRETDRKFQETDRLIGELREQSRETDRKFQDTDRRFQETDRKFQDTDRRFQETDRKFQDTDRRFQQTEKLLNTIGRQLGEQGNRLGDFVQAMVKPAVVRLLRERQLPVHQVLSNLLAFDDEGCPRMEIDLLVVNSEVAVAVECKSYLGVDDVREHLERLAQFKDCFGQYAGCRLLGAVAAMVLPDDVGRYAYRQGLFVLAQSGDGITIRNDARFEPRYW